MARPSVPFVPNNSRISRRALCSSSHPVRYPAEGQALRRSRATGHSGVTVTRPSPRPFRCARALDQGQSCARRTSRARTGYYGDTLLFPHLLQNRPFRPPALGRANGAAEACFETIEKGRRAERTTDRFGYYGDTLLFP